MAAEDFLRAAAAHMPGDHVALPVHELCARCGHKVRTYAAVEAIREMLAHAALRTEPDFADADRDAVVRLVPLAHDEPAPAAAPPAAAAAAGGETAGEGERVELPQVAPTVADLPSAHTALHSLEPGMSVRYASTLLAKYGHRQMPVLSAPQVCHGMVTWESIAQTALGKPDLMVTDCVVKHEVAQLSEKMFDLLPRVTKTGCAFVIDETGVYCGIVTADDLTTYLISVVQPFYVIGEIERLIRHRLNACFTPEEFARCKKKARSAGDLTFGDHRRLIDPPEMFARTGWNVAQEPFMEELKAVNHIRNAVMHFDGQRLPPADIHTLDNFRNWLRRLSAGF